MSQRYFLTAESTYEDLRQSLNTALLYPNALGKSVFQTALYAPRDNFRRVLLAVDTDLPGYATVSAAIAPLLDSDAMEEIDEATYLAALASATAGASAWNDITGKPSEFTPTSHAHGNITDAGAIGSTSGLVVTTGASGVLGALSQGTAGQVLKVNSGATGVEWVTLGSAASASTSDFAAASHNQAWSTITSTPTTRSGYGITDAQKTITSGTAAPTGGSDGDIYLQYT